MNKRMILSIVAILIIIGTISGCVSSNSSNETFVQTTTFRAPDDNVTLVLITGDKYHDKLYEQDNFVREEMVKVTSRTDIEIYQINTIYTKGYLLDVEIYYKAL